MEREPGVRPASAAWTGRDESAVYGVSSISRIISDPDVTVGGGGRHRRVAWHEACHDACHGACHCVQVLFHEERE